MSNNDDRNHRQRVKRAFLQNGLSGFEPHNALETLLFYAVPLKDTKPLAKELIERFGGFDKVLEADYEGLLSVNGVGEHTAVFLKLLLESYRYYERERNRAGFSAASVSSAKKYAKSLFVGQTREQAFLLCFNGDMELSACAKVSEGSVASVAAPVRRIVELATLHRASSVILAHNHPFGAAMPSPEDLQLTRNIARALSAIEIDFTDHIIVSARDALSFAETGIFDGIRDEIGD